MNDLLNFNEKFIENKCYSLLIWKMNREDIRLQPGKVGMFSYGWVLGQGKEDFPSVFALKRKKWIVDDVSSDTQKYILMFEGNIFS